MRSAIFLKLVFTSLAASCLALAIPDPTNTETIAVPTTPSFALPLSGISIRDDSTPDTCLNIKDWTPRNPHA